VNTVFNMISTLLGPGFDVVGFNERACDAAMGRRETVFESAVMCAAIDGRSGPVGAHPGRAGALLERWRAQCGMTRATIQQWAS
jgi:hypothetical protein